MNNGALDILLFYSDGLHLLQKGNRKLGKSILKAIDSTVTGPGIANPYKSAVGFTDFNLNRINFPTFPCFAPSCNSFCNFDKPIVSIFILKVFSTSCVRLGKPSNDTNICPSELVSASSVHPGKLICGSNVHWGESVITSNICSGKPISDSNVCSSKPASASSICLSKPIWQ